MKSRDPGGPVSRLYTKKIANSGAIWRYEKCVVNVHPIKLRCKTPKPRFSKIVKSFLIMEGKTGSILRAHIRRFSQ
jgi:hypothetical protein